MYWSPAQKLQHEANFLKFTPTVSDTYIRPSSAGLKKAKEVPTTADDDGDLLFRDPYRTINNPYHMVLKGTKNCPKSVKRCESCKIAFTKADKALIRTRGIRDFTSPKTGKRQSKTGNVYLHNLIKCLQEYDGKFDYAKVTVLKQTYDSLSEVAKAKIISLKMRIEK